MNLFQLYDTHGLPLEIIMLEYKENNIQFNIMEFIYYALDAGWKMKTIIGRLGPEYSTVYGTNSWNKIKICLESYKEIENGR